MTISFDTKAAVSILQSILTAVFIITPNVVSGIIHEPDSVSATLDDVVVTARVPVRVIPIGDKLVVGKTSMSAVPSILGMSDPLRFLETLPEVSTRGELSPGISVRGMDYSHNYTSVNGGKIINPYHLLGLFSTFNADHYRKFSFLDAPRRGDSPDVLGAVLDSSSDIDMEKGVDGVANIGLLSASATMGFPLSECDYVRVSARRSYIDKIFPGLLTFDHASLLYHFTDLNATYRHDINHEASVETDFFFSADEMALKDSYYDSDGKFGWRNFFVNTVYRSSLMNHRLSWSLFDNEFRLRESSFNASLPSSVMEAAYAGDVGVGRNFRTGAEINYRSFRPQRNEATDEGVRKYGTFEASAFVDWSVHPVEKFSVEAALRGSFYQSGAMCRFYPLPRVSLSYSFSPALTASVFCGRSVQFTHLVKESDAGLPANFWIGATERFRPQTSWIWQSTVKGSVVEGVLGYKLDAYYRGIGGMTEFDGSVLNTVGSRYDPLDDVLQGDGRSYGMSVTLSLMYGNFQGWASYTLGRSEILITELSDGYIPSNYDRRHDFGLSATYLLNGSFRFGISLAYATGTPYTEAAYGYMIGENLICQYFPHNSSRLSDYFRLDFSFGWEIARRGRLVHKLDVSFYNLTAHDNALFSYYTYSPDNGLVKRTTSFSSIIPGLSYTISF